MGRKEFVKENGGTCRNWRWSWSFRNDVEKFVIFGAWDVEDSDEHQIILRDHWKISPNNRLQPGYAQAIEHIHLIEHDGYSLRTFRMGREALDPSKPNGISRIARFVDVLEPRNLILGRGFWAAARP